MSLFAIGVDLGGTNLRIAAVDADGNQLETITTGTENKRGREVVVDVMCREIQALKAKYESGRQFVGTGIGVPGIIDMETGMVHESPNLPGWEKFPVRDEIERRLGARVLLENDANVAALGEHWLGAGRDYDSMCMLTLGTGVGGAVVLNKRIWHGMTGMAGEIGHCAVDSDGIGCGCSGQGCLEQYASATAIKRMALEAISSGNAPELATTMSSNPEFSAKQVFQMAINGDAAAHKIFQRVGRALGISLAMMINVLNLPVYVIGGGASAAWEAFAPRMYEELIQRSFVYRATLNSSRKTLITRALLGGDAGLIGAAYLAIQAAEGK